jgi:hypothetical protein
MQGASGWQKKSRGIPEMLLIGLGETLRLSWLRLSKLSKSQVFPEPTTRTSGEIGKISGSLEG